MIQRRQTLWLLLTAVSVFLSFFFPFASGKAVVQARETFKQIKADSDFILLITNGLSLLLSIFIIFLYKNRPLQMRLCLVGILISAVIGFLFIRQMNLLIQGTPALFSVLPFLALAGYVLAFRDIRKDERLVKSLEKLR
ncbi:MAG: DUF4293 domain-containing protein [Chitinophagaceae bacterium]|nr:DUF4293 domain-containing protein [Chitinophagaceae bacterium]